MRIFFAFILTFFSCSLYSQDQHRIDSLKNEIQKYDQSKSSTEYSLKDSVKVKLFAELWFLYADMDNKKALEYAIQTKVLSDKINYRRGIGKSLVRMGISYDHLGDYPNALRCYREAEKYHLEQNDKSGLMDCYLNRSIVFSKIGSYADALNYSQLALKLAEVTKDDYAAACIYTNVGIYFKQQGNYEDALDNHQKALAYFIKSNEKTGEAASNDNIAEVYLLKKEPEKAAEHSMKSISIGDKLGDRYIASAGYHSMGKSFLQRNMPDSALVYLLKSYDLRNKMEDQNGMANTLIEIGKAYYQLGNLSNAKDKILSGITLANKIGALEFSREGYHQLALISNEEKKFKDAYNYELLYKQSDDSLFSIEKTKEFGQLKLKYQVEKERDSLGAQYDRKMAVIVSENKSQEKIRNYIITGMIIIVILLVIAIILLVKLEAVKKQKSIEQERTRISRDLHDDLGSGLTSIMLMSEQMKFHSMSTDPSPTIEKIQTTSRKMVDQMGEIVWAMNSTNNSLLTLLSYLREYAGNVMDEANIHLEFNAPAEINDMELQSIIRRNVFLVVKEALNNILKYAEAKKVIITFRKENKTGSIRIADNGRGFNKDNTRKFGNGLKNMNARMEAIGGSFRIESVIDAGTEIEMLFPLKAS